MYYHQKIPSVNQIGTNSNYLNDDDSDSQNITQGQPLNNNIDDNQYIALYNICLCIISVRCKK